ncbi:MAG TPA: cyclase family protein [Oscillatoriaceae cyanobacterium M33_DOE_052]|uniref:Cyclase family protein n=1 Tax=Planktothricoides sp. SpSt-374 TaxID=2282167 RepID=A0A7C3VHP6_9CYAN|nr:cyclase family protein [Oscillatoriaceae cyanobacterium M33_DOE_052]
MAETPTQKTIAYSRIIHLSQIIHPQIPQWPSDPPVEFEKVADLEPDGYYLRRFSMGEHSATHMNAPKSFHPNSPGIDAYHAESLVVPAVVMNIVDLAAKNPDYVLTYNDVVAWEANFGKIAPGVVVLLYTGWQQKWANRDEFMNQQHFPGFAGETTKFLLQERQIAGVGIDTHGVDSGQDMNFSTNQQILSHQGIVLENLTNLDQLPPIGTTLAIGILRLRDGSGSPAAVMAFIP